MIEREIIHTNTASEQIFNVLQDVLEFVYLLIKVLWHFGLAIIKKISPPQLKDISNEIVLITGTAHGIGRELALHYAAQGSTVICVDINEKGNEETLKKGKRLNRGALHSYICDAANRDEVLNLARQVTEEVGPVSVLVNNIGIMPTHVLERHTPEEIRRAFDINVFSHFWALEAFLPEMKKQNRGHIIATSSIAGVVGLANLVPYCATKFAVRGMMESLMEELRQGPFEHSIKTTTVYPYMTDTGLCKKPKVKFPTLLGLLDPKDVAKTIVEAHRLNKNECTIPYGLLYINNFCRILPQKCALLFKDYIDGGVESD